MRACCSRRDRSFAQNRTVPSHGKRCGSVGAVQRVSELCYQREVSNDDNHVQRALGGQDGRRWAGRTVSRRHSVDLLFPRRFYLGKESTCSGCELCSTRSARLARAHRFARVVPLPQAVQQGVAPAPLYEGDGWGALAVLEYPRWEVTAQRRSVEVGTGGELFAPVDERLT